MIPRGAQPIVESLRRREIWTSPIIVSFTGDRAPFAYRSDLHIYPAAGQRHDWRWINGIEAWCIVKAGKADSEALQEIADRCKPYAGIVDVGTRGIGFLLPQWGRPPLIWHAEPGSEYHAAWGLE